MSVEASLPDDWNLSDEETVYDTFMDRTYTTLTYTHVPTGEKVIINDVQEPNNFGGWGYLVHSSIPGHGRLDIVDDLDSAREVATTFMHSYSN